MGLLRIVIISPGDVEAERNTAAEIVERHSTEELPLDCFRWEVKVAPGIAEGPVQLLLIDPKARIEEADIVVAIFGRRLGTPIAPGQPSGTAHEFAAAIKSYLARGLPHVMVYFKRGPLSSDNLEDLEQYAALLRFKRALPRNTLYSTYGDPPEFATLFCQHISEVIQRVREKRSHLFVRDRFLEEFVWSVEAQDYESMRVPGTNLYSSFLCNETTKPFWRFEIATTGGYVPEPKPHRIYIIRDPIRPFEIQIGEYRAQRHGTEPKEVPFEGVPGQAELKRLYPVIQDDAHRWLRIVLAELVNDPVSLKVMIDIEQDESIRKLIARNPSASDSVKIPQCVFCDPKFIDKRTLDVYRESVIIANDFPFGPFFHYIVFPTGAVHSWDRVTEEHLFEMNWLSHTYLKRRAAQSGWAGIRMGFNSSIRHLVMGRRTRTSAGASIAHVHKQLWGMPAGSVNLADHLNSVCQAYEAVGQDYLGRYLDALERSGLVIWKDQHVCLYVPFGQIAMHELQVMLLRPGPRSLLEMEKAEIKSLSTAEYIVTRLFGKLDVNSFNEVMLSLPVGGAASNNFRLVWTFITREVDLAMSELSMLYVVDRHPQDTMAEIDRAWPSRQIPDLDRPLA